MRLRELVRFEVAYQPRRPWLAFAVLVVFSFENTRAGMLPVTLPKTSSATRRSPSRS